jgi:G3E family GTPase
MRNTAVVINEIGQAGLDHILVRAVEDTYIADTTVLLGSGCLCCVLRTELADTLRDLFFKRTLMAIPEFDRLVIETTGLADPGPILANLLNTDVIREHYRLDVVVTTVDSVYGLQQLEQHAEARKQVAVADVLLLTKSDLADAAGNEPLFVRLAELNPGATQYRITHGEITPSALLDAGLLDRSGRNAQPQRWLRAVSRPQAAPQPLHEDAIASFTIYLPAPVTWEKLEPALRMLCDTYGEKLLRLKGILHAVDQPAPLAVHAVQHTLYAPTLLKGWNEEVALSRMVLVGNGLHELEIRQALMRI